MRKTKKQRLTLMEGKHHDKPPRYSRNGRGATPEPTESEVFNRRVEAQAAAGDPAALGLIAAFQSLAK